MSDDETAIHDQFSNTFVVKDISSINIDFDRIILFVFYFTIIGITSFDYLERNYELLNLRIIIPIGVIIVITYKLISVIKKNNDSQQWL